MANGKKISQKEIEKAGLEILKQFNIITDPDFDLVDPSGKIIGVPPGISDVLASGQFGDIQTAAEAIGLVIKDPVGLKTLTGTIGKLTELDGERRRLEAGKAVSKRAKIEKTKALQENKALGGATLIALGTAFLTLGGAAVAPPLIALGLTLMAIGFVSSAVNTIGFKISDKQLEQFGSGTAFGTGTGGTNAKIRSLRLP